MTPLFRYSVAQTLPFDRLSPEDFERLCLWLVRREGFLNVEHVGGANDEGCDLLATLQGLTYAFQCKRTRRFTFGDAKREIQKIRARENARPADAVVFVTSARVSTDTRRKTRALWGDPSACVFWSDTELDEMVKRHGAILDEFFNPVGVIPVENQSGVASEAINATKYLTKARAENLFFDVRGLGVHGLFNMELRQVYTRLRVIPRFSSSRENKGVPGESDVELTDDSLADATETTQLVDLVSKHRNLIIEGDPGSGKTTFLRFVCLNLSRALLDEDRAQSLERIGLTDGPLFPIFVRLSQFGLFLEAHPRNDIPEEAADHFLQYLDFSTKGHDPDLSPSYLRSRLLGGGCMLLLDGLDEVAGARQRQRVSRIIDQVAILGGARNNRHIVTSRALAYMGKAQLAGEFVRAELVEFNNQDIELFVHNWTAALVVSRPDGPPTRLVGHEQSLLAAINKSSSVRALAGNPLMLSVISILHFNSSSELPSQRTELFARIVAHLLESREDVNDLSLDQRADCLMRIAIGMYEGSRVVRAIELRAAQKIVTEATHLTEPQARDYLEAETLHSGIVVSRTQGQLEFWHLSFQEYLAARFLSKQPNAPSYFDDSLLGDRWREVLQHLAGCLMVEGVSGVTRLIEHILANAKNDDERLTAVGLVGLILRNLGKYPASVLEDTRFAQITQRAFEIVRDKSPAVGIRVKIDVFDALAMVGDHRLPKCDCSWTVINSGTFLMGAQRKDSEMPGFDPEAHRDESPVQVVSVPSFEISRYPVTVQQFQEFVASRAEGYLNEQYWSIAGTRWRNASQATAPGRWLEQLNYLNRPAVNITWYEAEAYCNWLTKLTGRRVRLPSEAEWEFVARGPEGKKFATLSDRIDGDCANYDGIVGTVTPVGLYAVNSSMYEIYDLVGNVWEWCQDSWFSSYEDLSLDGKARENQAISDRVRRGGSWRDSELRCRAAFRSRRPVAYANDLVGFRPVRDV